MVQTQDLPRGLRLAASLGRPSTTGCCRRRGGAGRHHTPRLRRAAHSGDRAATSRPARRRRNGRRRSCAEFAPRYEDERVVIRANSSGPGLVILSDNHYPGWKARVDGRDTPAERVDYLLRGVLVPPGAHTVEFYYDPLSWRVAGSSLSVALLALGGLALVGWRRRRGERAGADAGARAAGPSRVCSLDGAGVDVGRSPDV